ncbi:hypothetical protein [Streptomyces sp. 061-3]|uniref:hypothetical protein n=1 Tax=Streptomyces sp. 061-3 TaxID=2789268 RepID=UPI0039807355
MHTSIVNCCAEIGDNQPAVISFDQLQPRQERDIGMDLFKVEAACGYNFSVVLAAGWVRESS